LRIAKTLLHALVGALAVLLVAGIYFLDSRPDLSPWHTANLDREFTSDSGVKTFDEYLKLEDDLFRQLNTRVYDEVPASAHGQINRYQRGSMSDPGRWTVNWNRSYELPAPNPAPGVLLLHGLSDSPYSLHGLAQRLHDAGAWVVGLRIPGHGTAPAGLVDVKWQDMAAAVRLAVTHLATRTGGGPLYIVGYSNGAALAVNYTLSAIGDDTLPRPTGLILISPAIGVSPAAALAVWQARIGHLLGLDKLDWSDIGPEYDPYKYVSFAVNAGTQVYQLTQEIQSRLTATAAAGKLGEMPPILAFQSAVDATVSPPALVANLFDRLPEGGHELVLFDINRYAAIGSLLKGDPTATIQTLLDRADRPFAITVLGNESSQSLQVVERRRTAHSSVTLTGGVGLEWPRGIFSLSHVALPFAPDDSLYGTEPGSGNPGVWLGALALRGEKGVLQVSGADMLRLRWNPFYPYLERRVLERVSGPRADTP